MSGDMRLSTSHRKMLDSGVAALMQPTTESIPWLQKAPVVATKKPTKKPVAVTKKPTKKAVAATKKPTKKPVVVTKKPTKKPVAVTKKPTKKPVAATKKKPTPKKVSCSNNINKLGSSADKMYASTQQQHGCLKVSTVVIDSVMLWQVATAARVLPKVIHKPCTPL